MSKARTAPAARKTASARKRRKPTIKLPAKLREQGDNPGNRHWRTYFLMHLIDTSNVAASAKEAGIAPARAYRTRQVDPDFAAQWRVALAQGYQNLEMELLGYLRNPNPEQKMDVNNAMRLLTLHRQSVAQQRAQDDDLSEQEVLDSINQMILEMRERSAANAALLAEPDGTDEGD